MVDRLRPRHPLRTLLLAAGTLYLLRTAARMGRDVAAHRRSAARLTSAWTTIARTNRRPLRIHALSGGQPSVHAPTAVLVHGYGIGSRYLVPLADRTSERLHVLVPDLPGHGFSDHDTDPLTIVELADALAAWMDARGLRGGLLVGHSFGCQIVAEVASSRPDLAAGIVLICPASDPRGRTVLQHVVRGVLTSPFERPSFLIWAALDFRRAGLRVLLHEVREIMGHQLERVLPRVSAPALVIRGGRDRLVPRRWADTVARLLRAPAAVSVPGWGHALPYNDPGSVARIVLSAVGAASHQTPRRLSTNNSATF